MVRPIPSQFPGIGLGASVCEVAEDANIRRTVNADWAASDLPRPILMQIHASRSIQMRAVGFPRDAARPGHSGVERNGTENQTRPKQAKAKKEMCKPGEILIFLTLVLRNDNGNAPPH